MLTIDQLRAIAPGATPAIIAGIVEHQHLIPKAGVDTLLRLQHFIAQAAHESAGFTTLVENLNYGAKGLRTVFSRQFPSDDVALRYQRQPEKIANRAYANRNGNGSEESGDGWRFRGRGLFQLTGRENYRGAGDTIGRPIEDQPDLVAEFPCALETALAFWMGAGCNEPADRDDIEALTRRINGGLNGLDDRKEKLRRAKEIIREPIVLAVPSVFSPPTPTLRPALAPDLEAKMTAAEQALAELRKALALA